MSYYRNLSVAFGVAFAAVLVGLATDNTVRAEEDFSRQAPATYVSIYDDAPPATAFRGPGTRIHRILARGLDAIQPAESIRAWVFFKDKGVVTLRGYDAAIRNLAAGYDRRAVARRLKRRSRPGLFDEADLPVAARYVAQVEASGARVHIVSRWLNGVSVIATKEQLRQIDKLPFVKLMQPVRSARRTRPIDVSTTTESTATAGRAAAPGFYGQAEEQLTQMNLLGVHDLGYTGKNVVIGILDTGFERAHDAFVNPAHPVKVLAEWDFVGNDPDTSFEPGDSDFPAHGTWILGTIGAFLPNSLVGGAYDASFILCKTEDVSSETPVEEDNYVGGLEFIELHGGDMATASLSYLTFDFPFGGYTQADLDGLTAVSTLGVNVATGNGLHCLNAAGNGGHDADPATSTLGAPADAFDIITVGAVDSTGTIASFSSSGPTADGRVKPEVLARGSNTRTVDAFGTSGFSGVGGTSLSTPLVAGAVACLIDAYPNWSVSKMRQALFDTADYFVANGTFDPEFVLGYGIIDTLAALRTDCNENGIDDLTDIANGSPDCNGNGIPDECERDCNNNGVPDQCDTNGGGVPDCNGNSVPDECEMDCNGDGIPDDCETDAANRDCDFDGICNGEVIVNCPAPGMPCSDCNANSVPDACDLALRTSSDIDGDGVLDECLSAIQGAAPPHDARKNRYVSIDPTTSGATAAAIQVRLSAMTRCSGDLARACIDDADCPMGTGSCVEHPQVGNILGWVSQPWDASCVDESGVPNGDPCSGEYISRVVATPVFRQWSEALLHVGDCEIVPVATYEFRATVDQVLFSDPLTVGTIRMPKPVHLGDTVGTGTGDLPPLPGFTPPQGTVNISDVQAVQLTVQGPSSPSAHTTWVDLSGLGLGSPPNFIVNVADIQQVTLGLQGSTYTSNPDQLDPGDCP